VLEVLDRPMNSPAAARILAGERFGEQLATASASCGSPPARRRQSLRRDWWSADRRPLIRRVRRRCRGEHRLEQDPARAEDGVPRTAAHGFRLIEPGERLARRASRLRR
jgi:hypothetical protein